MKISQPMTLDKLRELADTPGPCVTLVLAGSDSGNGAGAIENKSALNKVRAELRSRGVDPEATLKSIDDAVRMFREENRVNRSVAVLNSPAGTQVFAVNSTIPAMFEVGDRFHARTLLAAMESEKHFYILALSQNRTRILECTESTSQEIPFPDDFPTSLAEAKQTRQPDHVLDGGSAGGPSNGAMGRVMFGTSTDREAKDEYMLHFFSQIDKAVNAALKGSKGPLIPVGVESELALYSRINTYSWLVEAGVHGAADGLDGREIHTRALELLDQQSTQPGAQVPSDFDKRVGTGHASTHIQDIVAAAWEGRVSHLFFQRNAQYVGTFDPVRQRVKHSDTGDLIEDAIWQTLLHGGIAQVVSGAAMPKGVPVCAVFRYPVPVAAATAGSTLEYEQPS
jgi:hypothetical protein